MRTNNGIALTISTQPIFKQVKNLFLAKDGIAISSPKNIEMIIETIEIKIVVVRPLNKNFRLVNPSILLGDKINQLSSLLPQEVKSRIKDKKNKFFTLKVIKN